MAASRSTQISWAQVQREVARAQAAESRAEAARLRLAAASERERQQQHADARGAEVAALNADLEEQVQALSSVLAFGLAHSAHVDFASLKQPPAQPPETYVGYQTPEPSPSIEAFLPPTPTGLAKLFGRATYQAAVAAGTNAHQQALAEHAVREETRQAAYAREVDAYNAAVAAAQAQAARQHTEIDAFEAGYRAAEPDRVAFFFELALTSAEYPPGFGSELKVAYVPESRQLVVEYDLPTVAVVPQVKSYRYVRSNDSVTESTRPAPQVRTLYASLVAQTALRMIADVFAADLANHVDVVIFNGMVDTLDPGSGRPIRPCLVTVRTTRGSFGELDLAQVDPLACLKHLSAGVSKSPAELVPVRPVLEFSMVDPRFIAESDALAVLDERPNLLELSPTEFESLIQNLFTKMGLETKQTRASRDGGVDCVAYDTRPIFGGKVVIQAKRYKNTVGVSAVRDLFGTLQNEGASKGILVTTSGYGQASFEFAQNKPIELIDGANLLYLLKAHADIDARIEAPTDWEDPRPDFQ